MPRATVSLAVVALASCAGLAPDPGGEPRAGGAAQPEVEVDWAASAAARLPGFEPCTPPGAPESVLCGTVEVLEDRSRPGGRTIDLEIVVVPAQTEAPPPDPVFIFEGGPGGAATRRAIASIYAGPVRRRDIVLVDQRGTGGSNALQCDWDPDFREGRLREMYPVEDVLACAAAIREQTDPRLYTTAHFVDDIEQVRRHLGYGPINIRGGSYGTASMMAFAQRHPESTRTLFGIGTVSPLRSNLAERGVWTDRTIDRLAELCAADPACARLGADLGARLDRLLSGLGGGPRRVELIDPMAPGESLTIDVGRAWLTEQLRLVLYFTTTSRALPWAIHRAHDRDDWQPLITLAVMIERTFRSALATGLALTIQCSEGMQFDVDAALEGGASTRVGNYRLEQQLQGCAHWPHEPVPPLGVERPVALDVPTLFLSGALDPVTPPEYADDAATLFPNSLNVVLVEGQHGPFDLEDSWQCVHSLWARFLDRAAVDGLDLACTERMSRPPFVVDTAGFTDYLTTTLIPFAA